MVRVRENNDPQSIYDKVCESCHSHNGRPVTGYHNEVACNNTTWKQHLTQGRLAGEIREPVSSTEAGSTCGW